MDMEDWTFPPRYDNNYCPDPSSRYWFPVRETMPAGDRDAAIIKRLQEVCTYAYKHSPFYKRKWDEAGFHPDQLRSLEDFEEKVPVITKRDLRASFVLDKIASARKVFATENEVHEELARMAASYNRTAEEMEEQMAQQGLLSSLRSSIRERKTIGELRDLVTITDATPGGETSDGDTNDEGGDA